ncbi:MAG: hypothetical protein ACWGSQ_14555 [Longimicrobiales bacterium]
MERLNALEWADGLCLVAFGVRVGIRVTSPEVLPDLLGCLPPGWRRSKTRTVQWLYSLVSSPSRRHPSRLLYSLYSGPDHLTQGSDLHRIRRILASDIQAQLALTSPWRVFVHAGAVGWRGRAIVLPGENETGKSTLTAALVRAGAAFFSDEFAVLDRRGRVHPYPLPLRLREEGRIRSREVTVEELGGTASSEPLPVGLILSLRYDPGGPGRLQALTSGRGAMELLVHATQARLRPARVVEAVGRAAENASVLKGRRGEAEDMARWVLSRLGTSW